MNILLVDDDKTFCRMSKYHISLNPNNTLEVCHTVNSFKQKMSTDIDLALIDYYLPDGRGEDLLEYCKQQYPDTEVVIVSGQEEISLAIDMMRKGAYDYVTKDEHVLKRIWGIVGRLSDKLSLKDEVSSLKKKLSKVSIVHSKMSGSSTAMQRIYQLLGKAAGSQINVIITGETGTGKELAAQTIHMNSGRARNNFVAINVAAIPSDLLESELFGHKKGAFTGATTDRVGKFEEANGGTVFLDEIGEMELPLQAKILRVLQEMEITRIGDNEPRKIDARIITATHRDLKELVAAGKFREDLYYRLLGLNIELPPLRDRETDIIELAEFFIKEFCAQNGIAAKKLSAAAKRKLLSHPFRGNIRELKSVIELACVLAEEDKIEAIDIQLQNIEQPDFEDNLFRDNKTMKEYELMILKHHLEKTGQNVRETAKILDIGVSSIYRTISLHKEIFA